MNTSTPWLSVLIPVYNVKAYLRECVSSVTAQMDAGVELILLDDCSTDGSDALLTELQGEAPGLRLLRHERNRGLSSARNSLLDQARGDYVWFLDSDDYLMPGAIDGLRRIVQAHQPELVICDFRLQRERMGLKHRLRGELHRHTLQAPAGQLLDSTTELLEGLFTAGHLYTWSKIAKRSLWGADLRFPEGRYFEDMSTTPLLALRTRNWWYVDQVWVAYRMRSGSILRSEPSVEKQTHMLEALQQPRKALAARADIAPRALFAWSHFVARGFIGASRHLQHDAALSAQYLPRFLEAMRRSMPLSIAQLQREYVRRGWLWRGLRFSHWLKKAVDAAGAAKGATP
jgi:glycosyltransferase involved in cell wall biosynthesis